MLDLWVTLFDGGLDPRQHGQGCTIRHYGCRWPVARLGALTHSSVASNWSASHEPRAANRECATTTHINNRASRYKALSGVSYKQTLPIRTCASSCTEQHTPSHPCIHCYTADTKGIGGHFWVKMRHVPPFCLSTIAAYCYYILVLTYARTSMHS